MKKDVITVRINSEEKELLRQKHGNFTEFIDKCIADELKLTRPNRRDEKLFDALIEVEASLNKLRRVLEK